MSVKNLFPKEFKDEICKQFRQLRVERGLSLEDLAGKVHISLRLLKRIDAGKCLTLSGFYKLVAFYGKKMHVTLE